MLLRSIFVPRRSHRLLLTAAVLSELFGCASTGKSVRGIDNFDSVNGREGLIYRGAQPTSEGIETLHQLHVRTVINLRDQPTSWEAAKVEADGMKYVVIPSDAAKVDTAQVRKVIECMKAAEKPVFVHCRAGRDRTGLAIAVYRIVEEHWTRSAAIKELHAHGYNWFLYPGIERFLNAFDAADYATP